MTQELERQHPGFLNPTTGELLPATVDGAATILQAARGLEQHIRDLKAEATAFLVDEATRQGKKTLHTENATVKLSGGETAEYDHVVLEELLRSAKCPEPRIREAIVETISYRVDKAVLKQLEVNPDYKAAIDLARSVVEKPMYASIQTRRSGA